MDPLVSLQQCQEVLFPALVFLSDAEAVLLTDLLVFPRQCAEVLFSALASLLDAEVVPPTNLVISLRTMT